MQTDVVLGGALESPPYTNSGEHWKLVMDPDVKADDRRRLANALQFAWVCVFADLTIVTFVTKSERSACSPLAYAIMRLAWGLDAEPRAFRLMAGPPL